MKHLRDETLIPYLDGRLPADERARLDRHLESCADCRTRLAEFRALLDTLNTWPAPEPSPGFTPALRARLAAEPAQPTSPWRWPRPYGRRWVYAGATALAAALLLVVVLWQPTPPPGPATPIAETPATRAPEPGDALATLEPLLLENYDLLREFDILFETPPNGETPTPERGT